MKLPFSIFIILIPLLLSAQDFRREVIEWDTGWEFSSSASEDFDMIPGDSWYSPDSDRVTASTQNQHVSWYKKEFFVNARYQGKRFFFRTESHGVPFELFLNARRIGSGDSFSGAFCFEISRDIVVGKKNTLLIRTNPDHQQCDLDEMYKSVNLIITNNIAISLLDHASPGVYVEVKKAGNSSAELLITTKIENRSKRKRVVEIRSLLFDQRNFIAMNIQKTELDTHGIIPVIQNLSFTMPGLWEGRKKPFLHKLFVEVKENGKIIDRVVQIIGIRAYSQGDSSHLILNQEQYPVYGVLYPAPGIMEQKTDCFSKDLIRRNLETIFKAGATAVKLPETFQSEYTYTVCDSLGLMVWADISACNSSDNDESNLVDRIRQGYNHPSLFYYCPAKKPGTLPGSIAGNMEVDPGNGPAIAGLVEQEDPARAEHGTTPGWWIPFDSVNITKSPDLHAWYRARWSGSPSIHINGKNCSAWATTGNTITVTCNLLDPVLEINGQRAEERENGFSGIEYSWKAVELKQGTNHIRVFAKKWGKLYEDSCNFVVK